MDTDTDTGTDAGMDTDTDTDMDIDIHRQFIGAYVKTLEGRRNENFLQHLTVNQNHSNGPFF